MIQYWLDKLANKLDQRSVSMLDQEHAYLLRVIAEVLREMADA